MTGTGTGMTGTGTGQTGTGTRMTGTWGTYVSGQTGTSIGMTGSGKELKWQEHELAHMFLEKPEWAPDWQETESL
jgi:hypothetical protein